MLAKAGKIEEAKAKVRETKWFYGYKSRRKPSSRSRCRVLTGCSILCVEGA